MSDKITKQYLINGLKQIYQNRKKRYDSLFNTIGKGEISDNIYREFSEYCQREKIEDSSQITFETINDFLKYYYGFIDPKSPTNQESTMYFKYASSCAEYCNNRIHNFSSEIFEKWFYSTITYDDFHIPSRKALNQKIEKLIFYHEKNIREYYIISPLIYASCQKSIKLNDDCIIVYSCNNLSLLSNKQKEKSYIKDICNRICKYYRITDSVFYKTLRDTFNNYRILNKEKFYYHPLLVIRVRDTFDNAINWSKVITSFAKYCLKLTLLASGKDISTKRIAGDNQKTPLRYFITSIGVTPYNVVEKKPQTEFKYDLSSLGLKKNMKQFNKLWKIILDNNALMNLYRKTLRIYFWDCNDCAKTSEHNDITTLMKIIAMETFLLFSTTGAKKEPLATILSSLYKSDDINEDAITKSLIKVYKSRSDFVHNGISIPDSFFEKYNDDFSVSVPRKDLDIIKKCFVNILCNFPVWYNKQTSKNKAYDNWKDYCTSLLKK